MEYLEKYKETLENLTLYSPVNKKIRMGRIGDGGYVIIDGYNYDCIISAGIDNEVTFENHLYQCYPNIPMLAFDGTVDRPAFLHNNIQYFRKNIDISNSYKTTNLKDILDKYKDVLVKMDIEGEEWIWLNSLEDSIKNIKQIVFESHAMFPHLLPIPYVNGHCLGQTPDEWTEHILNGLKKINETHYLCHIHENIIGPFVNIMGNEYPAFSELTFIRKDCEIDGLNKNDLPIPNLDYPCGTTPMPAGLMDKPLNYWPFKF